MTLIPSMSISAVGPRLPGFPAPIGPVRMNRPSVSFSTLRDAFVRHAVGFAAERQCDRPALTGGMTCRGAVTIVDQANQCATCLLPHQFRQKFGRVAVTAAARVVLRVGDDDRAGRPSRRRRLASATAAADGNNSWVNSCSRALMNWTNSSADRHRPGRMCPRKPPPRDRSRESPRRETQNKTPVRRRRAFGDRAAFRHHRSIGGISVHCAPSGIQKSSRRNALCHGLPRRIRSNSNPAARGARFLAHPHEDRFGTARPHRRVRPSPRSNWRADRG